MVNYTMNLKRIILKKIFLDDGTGFVFKYKLSSNYYPNNKG